VATLFVAARDRQIFIICLPLKGQQETRDSLLDDDDFVLRQEREELFP
jgi:hypothetical protein